MGFDFRQYGSIVDDYERRWRALDEELYALCQKWHMHDNIAGVYAKVWIIGNTYNTGIARQISSDGSQGSAMGQLANLLHTQGCQVDEIIHGLDQIKDPINTCSLESIATLHGKFTKLVATITRNGMQPRSFGSKYLHFHCPIVPIYDDIANRCLKCLYPIKIDNSSNRQSMDDDYRTFLLRFYQLYLDSKDAGISASIKMLDQCLLST